MSRSNQSRCGCARSFWSQSPPLVSQMGIYQLADFGIPQPFSSTQDTPFGVITVVRCERVRGYRVLTVATSARSGRAAWERRLGRTDVPRSKSQVRHT